jgi:hypothetical protein
MKLLERWLREEVVESLQEVVLQEQRLEPGLHAEALQRGDVLVGERERREPHQHLADVSTRQQTSAAYVSIRQQIEVMYWLEESESERGGEREESESERVGRGGNERESERRRVREREESESERVGDREEESERVGGGGERERVTRAPRAP